MYLLFIRNWDIVSIHAPAGGATRSCGLCLIWIWRFNPRARRGRDFSPILGGIGISSFNPRARRGRDCSGSWVQVEGYVSIHAPAGGATLSSVTAYLTGLVSIHAPAGGATYSYGKLTHRTFVSIHAPAGGATQTIQRQTGRSMCFNPRARRGRDSRPE